DHCIISYWDNVEDRLVVAQARDRNQTDTKSVDPSTTSYNLADFPARRNVLENRVVVSTRVDDLKGDAAEIALLKEHEGTARMLLPMIVREQAIGLIELETREPNRIFTNNESRLARTLASQAAVAIDNARLQTETASKLEELFVINELSTAL